jgi:hypothetical protein
MWEAPLGGVRIVRFSDYHPSSEAGVEADDVARLKAGDYLNPEQTQEWFIDRMQAQGYPSLEGLSEDTGINKGNLSRYFRQQTKPSVAAVAPLCRALAAAPETILIALGVLPVRRGWSSQS